MDLFALLGNIFNQKKQEQMPYKMPGSPYKSMQQAQNAEINYDRAFDRGDFSSPSIMGVDPRYFGYGPDDSMQSPQKVGSNFQAYRSPIIGAQDPRLSKYGQKTFNRYR